MKRTPYRLHGLVLGLAMGHALTVSGACGGGATPAVIDTSITAPADADGTEDSDAVAEPVDANVADADTVDVEADTAAADTTGAGCPAGGGAVIGPVGGLVSYRGARLTVPAGAVPEPTLLCIDEVDGPAPPGYLAWSPRYRLTPSGLVFATPARLEVTLPAVPAGAPAAFLSRDSGPTFAWLGATLQGDTVTAYVPHFSEVFIADGEQFADPTDTSCARTRLLEGRVVPPSGVALFLTADDCHGTPLVGLPPESFVLLEDDAPLTTESVRSAHAHEGVAVFVTLVFDMSTSTAAVLPDLVSAARAFVADLATASANVRVAVALFSGEAHTTLWQDFALTPADVLPRLDALADYVSPDPASTNLRGAVIDALEHSAQAQAAWRQRQAGGAFTLGHVVLFTDGRDTASWRTEEDALATVAAAADEVVAVGLRHGDYDEAALARLAPGGVYSALDGPGLETAFVALARRIRRQAARSYAVFYCSPKKLGTHEVTVRLADAIMVEEARFSFAADGFGPGCGLALFDDACVGRACGGLGCGSCDEARDVCLAEPGTCADACTVSCTAGAAVHPAGHVISCLTECDQDGLGLAADNCPWVDNADQADLDGDAVGDPCDDDRDGDLVANADDACASGAAGWASSGASDRDGDGCRDLDEDNDDDGDGVDDAADACAAGEVGWTATPVSDGDGDGCRDAGEDLDDDADGVGDDRDGCLAGAAAWTSSADVDHDDDGCRDEDEDDDDDNDGAPDAVDACPRGVVRWTTGPTLDHDGDGCRDLDEDEDDDSDAVADALDRCPVGALSWVSEVANDWDRDGCRDSSEDEDDDDDGISDVIDACPRGATGWSSGPGEDHDGDGCQDAAEDEDDDDDGLVDAEDVCPLGALAWDSEPASDHDGDGCQDATEDVDDDDDGVLDDVDACPAGATGWTATAWTDLDGDGCRDLSEDEDTDGDGVPNDLDACPYVLQTELDSDGDGCADGTTGLSDSDGDGLRDADDRCMGSGPCLCDPPHGWELSAEQRFTVVGPTVANRFGARFGADGGVCVVSASEGDLYITRETTNGEAAWTVLVHSIASWPLPEGASVVEMSYWLGYSDPALRDGVSCGLRISATRRHSDPTAASGIVAVTHQVLVEVSPVGQVVRSLRLPGHFYGLESRHDRVIGWGYNPGAVRNEIASFDPNDGSARWVVPAPSLTAGRRLVPTSAKTLGDGVTWVGGYATTAAGAANDDDDEAAVVALSAAGELLVSTIVGGMTPGSPTTPRVDHFTELSDGRLLLSGVGLHRALLDPTTGAVTDVVMVPMDTACCGPSDGWVDADCNLALDMEMTAVGSYGVGLHLCGASGPLVSLVYGHGTGLPLPIQVRTRPGAIELLYELEGHGIGLATFTPRTEPGPACDDLDACTLDASTPAGCTHELSTEPGCAP